MVRNQSFLFSILIILISSCKNEQKFSEVKELSEYKITNFIPTIEHKINQDRNAVYSVSLLYAWNQLRNEIKNPIEVSEKDVQLHLLNKSNSFIDALKKNEYTSSGTVDNYNIIIRAEFSKSLTFETKLQDLENKLVYDGQKVASFGVIGNSNYEQLKNIKIRYYKDDDNFLITLLPKDKQHEILLFKSAQIFYSMTDMLVEIDRLTKIGAAERNEDQLSWKYYFMDEDELVIPKFNFNIKTDYPSLTGRSFKAGQNQYQIESVWQRTAFILNENGAEIESEADIDVATDAMDEDYQQPRPKKMIFDKPFLILLKRTESKNPYFGLWTVNTELMIKE